MLNKVKHQAWGWRIVLAFSEAMYSYAQILRCPQDDKTRFEA
jgi:hypothetical protein